MKALSQRNQALRALFLGGVLPVIAFTVVEEFYGIVWGLVMGMAFGVGEILWEWRTQRRVETLTLAGNGMILVLGGVSLLTQEGIWFKLQPALIEAAMAVVLVGSVLLGRPLMRVFMARAMKKQGMNLELGGEPGTRGHLIHRALSGMTWRLGVFFALHALLATWAALHWSTSAWALLKGVGFTASTIVYLIAESVALRLRMKVIKANSSRMHAGEAHSK